MLETLGPLIGLLVPNAAPNAGKEGILETFGPPIGLLVLCALLIAFGIILFRMTVIYQNRLPGDRSTSAGFVLLCGWGVLFILMLASGLLLFFLIFLFIFIYMQNLRTKQQGFLWMLAISAQRNIRLDSAIQAYADEVGGQYGDHLLDFLDLLKSGVPLPDALGRVPLLVPNRYYPIIHASYESGNLAKGLREAASQRDLHQPFWGQFSGKILYIVGMIWIGISILSFIMIKIVPAYEKIFKDFGTRLPTETLALMSASHFTLMYWPPFALVFLLFFFLFCYSLLRYLGLSLFDLPGLGRFQRRKHAAEIMDNLAIAVENKQTFEAGLRTLARCYPNNAVRGKLCRVLDEVRVGAPWCESLFQHDLIRISDMAVLQAAERAGNLPWAMREMADSNRRRLAYRMNILVQMLFPPVVLCFGAMVMFIVVALFMPLITLIKSMS